MGRIRDAFREVAYGGRGRSSVDPGGKPGWEEMTTKEKAMFVSLLAFLVILPLVWFGGLFIGVGIMTFLGLM